jgi:hypothetical protein
VLEPSPPAVDEPPWFADDPVARAGDDGRPVVAPVATGDLLWADLARDDPELAAWCAPRWLADHPRLTAPPVGFAATRDALHVVGEQVLSPARAQARGGKIGLRWTLGGFGTPFFGDDVQLRVEGAELVRDDRDGARRAPLTTLREAGALAGLQLDDDRALDVDADASRWLGDLYGFASSVLEQLRAEAGPSDDPSRVQLWPEHFDMAVELGAEAAGRRAAYGVSPGDEAHDAPYLYVAPWAARPADPVLWNAKTFGGAELSLPDLIDAADQRKAALRFLRARREALAAG